MAVGLVLLSGVWFVCLLCVPFSGFVLSTKAILGTVFLLLMEGTFYLGVFLAGEQLLSRYWGSAKLRVKKLVQHRTANQLRK
jgi:hypothetical protein